MDPASVQANRAAQAEELEALRYIYGEDIVVHEHEHFCEISVYPSEEESGGLAVKLGVYFPDEYPSHSEPTFEAEAAWLSEQDRDKVVSGFHELYSSSDGEVIVFKWIEWMKEQHWLWNCEKRTALAASTKETVNDSGESATAAAQLFQPFEKPEDVPAELNVEELDKLHGIIHGCPFTEKKSTFQAHLAPVHSADEVETVMEALLRNRKISGATHNIMAFRIVLPDKNTVLQDYDDDGETAAGNRLLHLLQIVGAIDVLPLIDFMQGGGGLEVVWRDPTRSGQIQAHQQCRTVSPREWWIHKRFPEEQQHLFVQQKRESSIVTIGETRIQGFAGPTVSHRDPNNNVSLHVEKYDFFGQTSRSISLHPS
ncbi:protein IMPACT isoform X3 [Selaginella moellendorffii]|uniref:protein IMPACT isoform X3 n=1 Tax=Selaginella moellendorffii TaxID=88036 RepID=UPI000D1CC89D|nr:protein IMPACT isoform X3 [Selaginella moellendorffii]|eukprot:XP_024519717.1 protein IMPACT isoform X3 [Selaginella moellendorffii]